MSRILIGSRAAHHWFPAEWRPGVDWDYLSTEPIERDGTDTHFEPEFAEHAALLCAHTPGLIASPDFLYTLKVSHSFWPIKWDKTLRDLLHLKRLGCRLVPELYDAFYRTWERVHGPKKVNLNVLNEEFFTEHVHRVVPHDELHERFKYGDRPKYQTLKKDPSKALISRSMFFAQTREEQIQTVSEEMHVLAAERYLIPGVTSSPKHACHLALKLLVTSASKGWFPLFVVDNWSNCILYGIRTNDLKEIVYEQTFNLHRRSQEANNASRYHSSTGRRWHVPQP